MPSVWMVVYAGGYLVLTLALAVHCFRYARPLGGRRQGVRAGSSVRVW
ncbi:MAG: hypothetical protein ACPLRW_00010 [Moorellales bacterium]